MRAPSDKEAVLEWRTYEIDHLTRENNCCRLGLKFWDNGAQALEAAEILGIKMVAPVPRGSVLPAAACAK